MQMLGHQEMVVFYELFVTYFSFRQSVTSFRLITMDCSPGFMLRHDYRHFLN